jgi:outer membrane autotransporter protein
MAPKRVRAEPGSAAVPSRVRHELIFVLFAALASVGAPGSISLAQAASCSTNGQGQVNVSGTSGSCTVSPGQTVNGIVASNSAQVGANGVQVSVPYGTAATAQGGGLITFGIDPTKGGSSIVSQYGGGGLTGLLANGAGSEIDASGLTISFPGGGNILVWAENGGVVRLDDGTLLDILNSGGNQGLLATGAGSQIIANGITVEGVLGGGDFGVHSQSGAAIQITDSTVSIIGPGGGKVAVQADSSGTLTANGVTVTLAGSGGDVAVKADTSGAVSLSGGSVTVTGTGGGETGLLAQSAGSTITATNVPISVSGTGGDVGAKATSSGAVTLSGGSVTMPSSAGGERGVWASGAGSTLTADGVTISVPASMGGVGALADSAGSVTLGTGTGVSTGGAGTLGLQATGSGSSITATGSVAVATAGANATGVDADTGGTVSLNGGGSVTTTGAGAAGFNASAGTIGATDITTQTSGASAPGGLVQNGGALAIDGGSVTTTGGGSYGFLFQGASGATNTLAISGATVGSAADAFRIQGTTADITIDGSSVTGNNGILLSTAAPAIANLDAGSSQLTGAITTDSGSTTNVTLNDNTIWTATGNSTLTTLANNQSLIAFSPPVNGAYKSITASGNYSGSDGGLQVNTFLNRGGPLSNQLTDRLLIQGDATGTTTIEVRNAGGPGDITSFTGVPDPADGISIVQVANDPSPGTFTLPGGYVDGGTPFAYHLNAYGPGFPNGSASPSQSLVGNPSGFADYRLQSAYVDPGGPVTPEPVPTIPTPTPTPTPSTPLGPDGIPDPGPSAGDPSLPSDARPEVAPQVPAYLSTPRALFETGFLDIDSLHRRLGEIRDDETLGYDPSSEVFVRVYGGAFNYTTNRSFEAYGYNFNLDYSAVQFGGNWMPIRNDDGTLRVGLAGTLGRLWMQPSAIDGESKALFNTESLGGFATWQANSGWYVDGIVMGGMFDGRYTTVDRGETTGVNGTSLAVSIESGIPFALPWWDLSFEPQAQLVWQHLNFPDRTDVDGINVDMGSPNQGVLRLGFRLKRPFETQSGMLFTPYLKANLLQGIGGSSDVVLSGIPFGTGTPGTALQAGGGITGTLTRHLALYGDVAWQSNVTVGGYRGWLFNGGIRLSFGEPPPSAAAPVAAPAPSPVRSYLVFFDWDDASLSDRARQVIAEAAAASSSVRSTRIEVNGYTDTSGTPSYNQGLSVRRAQVVAAELVRDGVAPGAIAIHGFGETHLLVPTGPGVREAQNRRVEIFIR